MTGTGHPAGRDPGTDRGETGHPTDEDLWLGKPQVRSHLSSCPTCQARLAQQERQQDVVATRLRSLGGPVPVPTEVAQRLRRAVDEEATRRGASVVPLSQAPQPSRPVPRSRRLLPQLLVAACVVAVLVVGGSVLVPLLGPGTGGDDGAITAESAPSDTRQESQESTDLAAGVPPVPDALLERGQALVPSPTDEATGDPADVPAGEATGGAAGSTDETTCGAAIAQDTGGVVVATSDLEGPGRPGVLVVTQTSTGSVLWWLPDCESGVERALGRSSLDDTPAGMPAP